MQLAMIGLGKMGANMTTRLLEGGHELVVYDHHEENIAKAVARGATSVANLADLGDALEAPRVAWSIVPAGDPTASVIGALAESFAEGDIVIDGGNSNYRETMSRAAILAESGIRMVDVGTSGGVWGLTEGYSMMVGGDDEPVSTISPILETLAPSATTGWGHVGPSGGFEILQHKEEFGLDLHQIAEIWRHGSVVRSWLLDLTSNALAEDSALEGIKGWVADSGEGRWTVADAIELDVPAPVITLSLLMRFVSRQDESYAAKLLAAMRNQFGGHAIKPSE